MRPALVGSVRTEFAPTVRSAPAGVTFVQTPAVPMMPDRPSVSTWNTLHHPMLAHPKHVDPWGAGIARVLAAGHGMAARAEGAAMTGAFHRSEVTAAVWTAERRAHLDAVDDDDAMRVAFVLRVGVVLAALATTRETAPIARHVEATGLAAGWSMADEHIAFRT